MEQRLQPLGKVPPLQPRTDGSPGTPHWSLCQDNCAEVEAQSCLTASAGRGRGKSLRQRHGNPGSTGVLGGREKQPGEDETLATCTANWSLLSDRREYWRVFGSLIEPRN